MAGRADFDGEAYQRRFDRLAASGTDVHGEATFVRGFEPAGVLDAGCGTGRVAIELAGHGIEVVGVDRDRSMLETARRLAPDLHWVEGDLTDAALELGRRFEVVVMAGNVPLFTPAADRAALVATCARHLEPGGCLVAGFSTDWADRPYSLAEHEDHCRAAGLVPRDRFSTWERSPWSALSVYAVSVAVRAGAA